jgi:hypothetical protein
MNCDQSKLCPHSIAMWLSLSSAASYLDVSVDTMSRRAAEWSEKFIPDKVRWKHLKLGEGTRKERRYFVPDLEALLH